jgi:hypothetical protein
MVLIGSNMTQCKKIVTSQLGLNKFSSKDGLMSLVVGRSDRSALPRQQVSRLMACSSDFDFGFELTLPLWLTMQSPGLRHPDAASIAIKTLQTPDSPLDVDYG